MGGVLDADRVWLIVNDGSALAQRLLSAEDCWQHFIFNLD